MRVVVVPPGKRRAAAWAPAARIASLVALCLALGSGCAGGILLPAALAGHLGPSAVARVMAAVLPPLLLTCAILAAAAYLLLLGDGEGAAPVARHGAVLSAASALVCRQLAIPAVLGARGSAFAPAHAAAVALFGLSLAAAGVALVALTAIPARTELLAQER